MVLISLVSLFTGIALFQIWLPQRTFTEIQNSVPVQEAPDTKISLLDIPIISLQGEEHRLADWQEPVLIINFWAPWCVPCLREVPDLIKIKSEYGEQVQILGLALDSKVNIQSFAESHAMNYPSFLASQHIAMYNAVFGNSAGVLPFTAILDQERQIHFSHTGQISLETLQEEVQKLLQE